MGVALGGVVSVGVLTPHASPGPEIEFAEMAGEQVVTRLVRIPAQGATREDPGMPPTTAAGLREIAVRSVLNQAAAEAMGGGQVDAFGYASTTSGYATGFDAETTLLRHVSHEWGVPVAGSSSSAADALRSLDVQRLTLVHPPWFDEELNELGAAYFQDQGFTVLGSASADLPNDPSLIRPGAVIDWVSRHVGDEAEAVVIGGNGFRAAQAIDALERRLGCLVIESNQALLWSILSQVHAGVEIQGYGRLLRSSPPPWAQSPV
jgi:maleate isomerase